MDVLFQITPSWQILTLAGVFGSLWGSFANVVIVRWPQELSVLRPSSHCFSCKQPIRFYDNVPLLSYLVLRGRCRHCGARFSARYLVVELAMTLLSIGVAQLTLLAPGSSALAALAAYFIWFAFVWAMLVVGMIDLKTYLIPDAVVLPGVAVGLLAHWFVFKDAGWIDPLIATAAPYAVLSLFFVHGYKLLTGKQGMGEGDPKLLAMIGAFLGLRGAAFALCTGALQGLAVGSILVLHRRRTGKEPSLPLGAPDDDQPRDTRFRKAAVPFGPFLALGAIEHLFFGELLLDRYTGCIARLIGL